MPSLKAILLILVVATVASVNSAEYKKKPVPKFEDFRRWTIEHGKHYHRSSYEWKRKFETFVNNHYLVEQLNQDHFGETEFFLNKFADMTPEEFKANILMTPRKSVANGKQLALKNNRYDDIPSSFDWRNGSSTPVVTPVKDQGTVGTCWAHAAIQNIEGQFARNGNPLISLSVEQVVDCDGEFDSASPNADCGVYGGWPYLVYQYVKSAGGLTKETDYPYCCGLEQGNCVPCGAPGYNDDKCGPPIPFCSLKDSCQAKVDPKKFVSGLEVIGWKRISKDEKQIAQALYETGPLSIALNAELLQFYHSGVFDPITCDPSNLDHAVLIVGYGTDKGLFKEKPFWTIKNSWGPKWGEQGYFRIMRGKGTCGVNTQVATSVLKKN